MNEHSMAMRKNRARLRTATWLNLMDMCSVKEARHREHTDSVHVKFKSKQNHSQVTEVRVVISSGGSVLIGKRGTGAF